MAIAYVAERGAKVENVLNTSMTCTVTGTTTVGNYLFVIYSSRAGDGTPSTLAVTDSKRNTWTVDKIQYDASANDYTFVASARITNPLVASDVVTITFGVSLGPGRACTLQEFSGIAATSARDQTGGANHGSNTAVSVPTAGATDTADELVLLAVTSYGSNTAWTVGTDYSEFTTKAQADGATIARVHYGEYRIVTSTGVQTATCTSPSPNTGFTGAVATYRAEPPTTAIQFGDTLGSAFATPADGATTVSFVTTDAVPAGSRIVVGVSWLNFTNLSSVSGGGLTWVVDKQQISTGLSDMRSGIASAYAPAGIASGVTITATFSGSSIHRIISGVYLTDAADADPIDVSAGNGTTQYMLWDVDLTTTEEDTYIVAVSSLVFLNDDMAPIPNGIELYDVFNGTAIKHNVVGQAEATVGAKTIGSTWVYSEANKDSAGSAVAYRSVVEVELFEAALLTHNVTPLRWR